MKPCRYCGGPPLAKLYRQHRGYVCLTCCRAVLRKRDNHTSAGTMRRRRHQQTDARRAQMRRRITVGRRYFGLAATVADAEQMNQALRARLVAFKDKQMEDRRAAQ